MKQAGIPVQAIDLVYEIADGQISLDDQVVVASADRILSTGSDIVGISVQAVTLPTSLGIAKEIKRRKPGILIVFGGYGASFMTEELLGSYPQVDVVAVGEGEETLVELVRARDLGVDFADICGLVYRDAEGKIRRNADRSLVADLMDLPELDYTILPSPKMYKRLNEGKRQGNRPFPVDSGRGCSFSCNFCSSCLMFRRRSRVRAPEAIVAEMAHLNTSYGIDHFLLTYDLFNARSGTVEAFCEAIEASSLTVTWECRCRLDLLNPDLAQRMADAGCRNVLVGIESGSDRILKKIRKKLSLTQVRDRVAGIIATGITPIFSFVVGFPQERPEDVSQTLWLLLWLRCHEPSSTTLHLATPLPGTDLAGDAADMLRLSFLTGDLSEGIGFHSGALLPDDLDRIVSNPALFSTFYNIDPPYLGLENVFIIYRLATPVAAYFARTMLALAESTSHGLWELFLRLADIGEGDLKRTIFTPEVELRPELLAGPLAVLVRELAPRGSAAEGHFALERRKLDIPGNARLDRLDEHLFYSRYAPHAHGAALLNQAPREQGHVLDKRADGRVSVYRLSDAMSLLLSQRSQSETPSQTAQRVIGLVPEWVSAFERELSDLAGA